MKHTAIVKLIEKGDSMTSNSYTTDLEIFGNTKSHSTDSDGVFSSASIQRGKILLDYCGNVDLITVYIFWHIASAKGYVPITAIRNSLNITAVRMTRANKILIKLGLIKLAIDNTDGRHRILTLTDKGKALKLDLINTLTK